MTKKYLIWSLPIDSFRKSFRGPRRFRPEAIQLLADFCAAQNPHFDRERWLTYITKK